MATKLRKFSYSVFVKVIIFLLTAASIALAGRAVFKMVLIDVLFTRNYAVSYRYTEDYFSSPSFYNMVGADIDRIETYMELYRGDEEYVKSGKAWADCEAQLRAECEEEIERKTAEKVKYYIDVYGVSGNEYATAPNDSDVSVPSTTPDNSAANTVYTMENARLVLDDYYYGLLENEVKFINNDEKYSLKTTLTDKKRDFINDYEIFKNEIAGLENLKFIYDDGSLFLTNIDGLEKREDGNYSEALSSFPYSVSSDGMVINNMNVPSYIGFEITEYNNSKRNVSIAVNRNFPTEDKYSNAYFDYKTNYSQFKDAAFFGSLSAFAALLGMIYLAVTAGRKDKNSPLEQTALDRCYNDLHLIISGAIIFGTGILSLYYFDSAIYAEMEEIIKENAGKSHISTDAVNTDLFTFIAFVCALFFLEWFMSFVRAIKARTLIKHSLWYVIGKKIKDFFRRCSRAFSERYHFTCLKKYAVWKLVLFFGANALFLFLGLIGFDSGEPMVFFIFYIIPALVFNIPFIVKSYTTVKNLDKVFGEIRKGAEGDFNFTLDYSKMKEPVKGFARDAENMQNGLKRAVNEAVKGERMKTELITNVSHDLKTPLTSIINYVDLLGRCDITDETAKEYIGVLSDKSAKLKKLIEDLVEASKASTGNLKINKIKMNLYELAVQAVGENEDVLSARGIEVRINAPQKQPVVLADNQKTWRIIDNLFSNVKKYSLKGSRAYITVDEKDGWGRFSIKNISEKPLDIEPEELTQRFVRGDASRSTEGSGLGLSIAKSLCELQGGRFTIEIDGDLFKATLELPLAPENDENDIKSFSDAEAPENFNINAKNMNALFNFPADLQ